jgi:uncharacterized repeat protein (TIGR03803 family)
VNKSSGWKTISTIFLFWAATAIATSAQTVTILHNFDQTDDGSQPEFMSLIQGTDGNLYGTTSAGAANAGGTVFKITLGGTLTTLHSFCAQSFCADGQEPLAGLVQASDGNFYGTTYYGGADANGEIFKITPAGTLTTFYSFCAINLCGDGTNPHGALIQGTDGNLYRTTQQGGTHGDGTVFKITLGGQLTTLYSFCSQALCADGSIPDAGLVQGSDGNFYGTTERGGPGDGSIFKITPSGVLTNLYSFCIQSGCPDGGQPLAPLAKGTDGNFYGTTEIGGANNGGTVFKMTRAGVLTTLHNFAYSTDGSTLYAPVVQGNDGNFYGVTNNGGGGNSVGTAYKITPTGTLTTLYNFCSLSNCSDGASPEGGLVQDTNGTFYGTTNSGGIGWGTVFSLATGLHAFVETRPTSGKVGTPVIILGNGLTGATSVTFNGTAATFTVVSSTEIKTKVPTGATSGKVKVVTSRRTLVSNVAFNVK